MRIYVTFEKVVKEVQLDAANETVVDLRKQACKLFDVNADDIVLRSGTRPVKDNFVLKNDMSINMGRIKPLKPEIKDDDDEYEYVYEEVTDEDEDYNEGGNDDEDEEFPSDDE